MAHVRQQPADHAHRWRVRAGAVSLLAVAVGIPLAAGAAAQPTVKGHTAVPATKVSAQASALAKRIPKAKAIHHAKAKPATPVTTAPPKPVVTAPPPTAPPTTRYVPPAPRYVPPTTRYVAPAPAPVAVAVQGSGRCGGNLPPCYVMMRESKGIITARNPSSTASGKWQFLNSTWKGYGGYASAAQAPESVQDAYAAQVWAGGAGCSNWSAC